MGLILSNRGENKEEMKGIKKNGQWVINFLDDSCHFRPKIATLVGSDILSFFVLVNKIYTILLDKVFFGQILGSCALG